MRILQIALFLVSSVALSAPTAWGQFGLYGSPDVLNLSQTYAAQRPSPLIQQTAATWQKPGVPAAPAPPEPPSLQAGPASSQPAAPAQNLVDQMLGGPCCDEPSDQAGCFRPAVDGFAEAACGGCGYCCPWYATVSALVMSRNQPNRLWTSYEDNNEPNQLCNTKDIGLKWRWGGEVRFGRRFGCGCGNRWALEATYWTLDPFTGQVDCTHPNGVSTPLTVGQLSFGVDPATDWFDGAAAHRLRRWNEFQNVELNLISDRLCRDFGCPWNVDWAVGVRYFRFEEHLIFGSLASGGTWGADPAEEAYLDDRITNSLVGFQFGFDASYQINPAWRLFVSPKFGIYNNNIRNNFNAYLGDGTVATQTEYPGYTYPVSGSRDVLSFLTQIDLGLEWQFTQRWSARVGYRVLAATGIGLADNQFPPYIVDMPELADIDYNGELILHGGFVGLTCNF